MTPPLIGRNAEGSVSGIVKQGGEAEAGPFLQRTPHPTRTQLPHHGLRLGAANGGTQGTEGSLRWRGAPVPSSFPRNRQVHRAAFRDPLAAGCSLRLYFFWPRLE